MIFWKCSICGLVTNEVFKRCPSCGVDSEKIKQEYVQVAESKEESEGKD